MKRKCLTDNNISYSRLKIKKDLQRNLQKKNTEKFTEKMRKTTEKNTFFNAEIQSSGVAYFKQLLVSSNSFQRESYDPERSTVS